VTGANDFFYELNTCAAAGFAARADPLQGAVWRICARRAHRGDKGQGAGTQKSPP